MTAADPRPVTGSAAGPIAPSIHVPRVTVLCGGVGAARYLAGLRQVLPTDAITAVVNTGDDLVLHGLSISPDLDTITYTVSGAIDPGRGWGLADETWRVMASLGRFADVRPPGSGAGATWFNLGDQDLATHCYRTARLDEGATLTVVTDEIRRAFGIPFRLLPMTDVACPTVVTVPGEGEITFQEYFVGRRHAVAVSAVRFGDGTAAPTAEVLDALDTADVVVIAPSNPIVSIGPLLALPGVRSRLEARRERVVAVSPIVGGAALKGPADRMLVELGHESSVVGVARLYAPVAAALVIDDVDAASADEVAAAGMRAVVTGTVMSDPARAAALARATLEAVVR
jgi:LPPG:FO 2-phospho-L-lactate transferase